MSKEKLPIVGADGYMHFERMTKAQKNAMNHVAFNGYATSTVPSEKTLQSLIDAGLIIERKRVIGGHPFPVTVKEYDMPLVVHMAWCFNECGDEE